MNDEQYSRDERSSVVHKLNRLIFDVLYSTGPSKRKRRYNQLRRRIHYIVFIKRH